MPRGRPSLLGLLVETYLRLLRWRSYAEAVARAARDLLGPDTRVYVVGGAAEGRLTVLSDIDIVVVSSRVPASPRERRRLRLGIRERAVNQYGLPWDIPVDIHLYTPEELEKARRYYKRLVEVAAGGGTGP